MAKLFGEYVSEEDYKAFRQLLDLTREKKCRISVEMATAKHNEDSDFPAPNSFARCAAFSDFSDAAHRAYVIYQRELPDEEEEEEPTTEAEPEVIIEPPAEAVTETGPDPEDGPQDEPEPPSEEEPQDEPEPPSEEESQDEPEPPSEEEPQDNPEEEPQGDTEPSPEEAPPEEYDPSDTECDPFDEGPDSTLDTGLATSSPTVSLINYLFNCLVRIPDASSKNGYFYAENNGFYAEVTESDGGTTEMKYIARSSVEDTYNLFTVKRPNPPILEIVSQDYDEQIRIPFPGPRKDIYYIVSKPFAEAARATGRTTDDLIYIEDYERITGTKYNEILVKEFRGL